MFTSDIFQVFFLFRDEGVVHILEVVEIKKEYHGSVIFYFFNASDGKLSILQKKNKINHKNLNIDQQLLQIKNKTKDSIF